MFENPSEILAGTGCVAGLGSETGAIDALRSLGAGFAGDGDEEVGVAEGSGGTVLAFGERLQVGDEPDDHFAWSGGSHQIGADGDTGVFGPDFIGFGVGEVATALEDIDEAFLAILDAVCDEEVAREREAVDIGDAEAAGEVEKDDGESDGEAFAVVEDGVEMAVGAVVVIVATAVKAVLLEEEFAEGVDALDG